MTEMPDFLQDFLNGFNRPPGKASEPGNEYAVQIGFRLARAKAAKICREYGEAGIAERIEKMVLVKK